MMLPKPVSAVYNVKENVYVLGFSSDLEWALIVYRDYKSEILPGPGNVRKVDIKDLMLMMHDVAELAE